MAFAGYSKECAGACIAKFDLDLVCFEVAEHILQISNVKADFQLVASVVCFDLFQCFLLFGIARLDTQ